MDNTIKQIKRFQLSRQSRQGLNYGISLACMVLFLATAYSKLAEHAQFAGGLSRIPYLGTYSETIAWAVPVAEIMVSIVLIIPFTNKWGLYGFTSLMIVFTVYILGMLLWVKKIPCYCGAAIEQLTWSQHIWFNLGFIALAIFALWLTKTIKK